MSMMKTNLNQESIMEEWQPEDLNPETKEILGRIANTIRQLAMDANQKANSGHPGLPLGCAEIGAYLWGWAMRFNPKNPHWINRDRFILSAGHGCLLQYACLHLSGYDLSIEDLKNFRQLHSKTPGHPEKLDTAGIETTTGPLGQGFGNAAGTALGLKLLAEKFNTETCKLFDNKVITLAGDGCIMEGVTSEVSSLSGHLKLDNLIAIYDSNNICLDGPLAETCSEDTLARYKAYGWDVFEVDGHDFDSIHRAFSQIRHHQERPCLILAHTIIGKGAPNKAGTHKAHGSPLGEEEVRAAKVALGLPEEEFYIPQAVINYFESKQQDYQKLESNWNTLFSTWADDNKDKAQEFGLMLERKIPDDIEAQLNQLEIKTPFPGRKASQAVTEFLGNELPFLYGGSADLSCSDMTMMKQFPIVAPGIFTGRNIKFGVREFGMGTMAIGLYQTQMILPYVGTFLTFTDYMRNSIRLAALQQSHVIYQMTHDSIFLGQDGPTHQPVEHYASLRTIPHLHFIRPAGNHEVKMAWIAALRYVGPTIIALTRQNIPDMPETVVPYAEGLGRGAYIVKKESGQAAYTLVATGSELSLALDTAKELEKRGHPTRVVSMPCWELFEAQDDEYQQKVFGGDIGKRVAIEAGVDQGWHKYIGREGIAICMEDFGASAPYQDIVQEFGYNVDAILERIL
ncbi:MAG: Transketolase [Chlamydiae bacterium]|nr:Transketolase [Chlamydiota bacterium]